MAITKEKKINLIKEYVKDLQEAKNLVIIRQSGLAVSTDMEVRKNVRNESGKFNVIRKRLFLRALKEAGYPEIDLSQIPGSAVAVYAKGEEYAPLKVINKYIKTFQKDKDSTSSFEFLLGYFDGERKDLNYIDELANIPSREELLSKLVRLFNYPVQSLTSVLNQIAKKKSEEIQEEKSSEETQEEKSFEETQEEAKEEAVSTTDTELAENSKAQTTSE
ncbi:MAG TPA: 50S ribosomal protein L10 [Candidatus Absconditabacterales bacterium]|nr:50S ribosomal protein L10 [Candidatus Absconditabacterales bacterium]HOQ78911.1 50S ribosomal protein L10 [Candidatus Absconditabacterales bacterium]HPK27950.1 50S ribosomal protein L10 [Candidatus Absconditabacterales bacterium]